MIEYYQLGQGDEAWRETQKAKGKKKESNKARQNPQRRLKRQCKIVETQGRDAAKLESKGLTWPHTLPRGCVSKGGALWRFS